VQSYPAPSFRHLRSCRATRMPALTRRRSADCQDCWHIYYGDVQAGTIAMRAGNPREHRPLGMVLRLLSRIATRPNPVRHIRDLRRCPCRIRVRLGEVFLANRTDADFQAWRYQRDSTAWKYATWDRGFKLPTQLPSGRSKCLSRAGNLGCSYPPASSDLRKPLGTGCRIFSAKEKTSLDSRPVEPEM
jgi:hypothetical protein